MFKKINIPFSSSKVLSNLVQDYVDGKEQVKQFYNLPPTIQSFKKIISENNFKNLDRNLLVSSLLNQAQLTNNSNELSITNINLLANKNTFTITTGHQLCLFTGPMYFIYKIISTINLCQSLKKEYPQNNFVPVYWMASEDHDFEEINNFTVYNKQVKWDSKQTGAVGKFNTQELAPLLPELMSVLGPSENAKQLIELFENSYLKHNSLKEATRFLVNELFGKYGLVVVDGDDKNLKSAFVPFFIRDIFKNETYLKVTRTNSELEKFGYKIQVNPREINCFYMHNAIRSRIEKVDDNNYKVVDTDLRFSKSELETIIKNETDKISPNVVLRPLYQQYILPNLAYVGGPGELSYWLQYLNTFTHYAITFPILMPRAFATIIEKPIQTKIDKLKLSSIDIYKSEQELITIFQTINNSIVSFDSKKITVTELYNEILSEISSIDKTLEGSVKAELQKALSSIDVLTTKANKALKNKSEVEINQIKTIKSKLFPNNLPQERVNNFSEYYINFGMELIDELKNNLNAFDLQSSILV